MLVGCTSPSTKLAIQSSKVIEAGQDEIVNKLSYNVKLYQYNELKERIARNSADPTYLNEFWNAREGLEMMLIQWERLRALRLLTIDTKLISDQSIIDLKYKNAKERYDEINNAISIHNTPTNDPVTP